MRSPPLPWHFEHFMHQTSSNVGVRVIHVYSVHSLLAGGASAHSALLEQGLFELS